ncbi:bactofilin family protein [Natrinema altunense]|uniref:Polymer-forming cytoskeletal protein n=1 Tax=Natrinema altunense (strain JCM 12890 / CGMCC 1.3731 / AJ2) TaxID=1227494 RepID=L9ZUH8_NATA2|nr:polymer-forming cytoskeletal protein [Natrinema altunense]ELY89751.1 hypothetical protein C485_04615 [Natrinema altunense JCM 12890]
MVTVPDRHRDRGQLLLVGAITLAFIILGAVVVYNGVLATETVASGPTGQTGPDAKVTNEELENGLGGLAHRGNIDWDSSSGGSYGNTLDAVITGDSEYAESYLNTTASSRPTATQIETVDVVMEARVATNPIGNESVDLLNNESAINTTRRVGHFALEFDPDDSDGDITVRSVNSSGGIKEVTIEETGSGYEVQSEPCSMSQPVRIDFVHGTINGTERECGLELIDPDESYDEVELSQGDDADGSYELVVKGDQDIDGIGDVDYGAWDIAADVTYTSNEASYTRLQRVPIYTDGPQNPLGLVPTGTCSNLDIDSNSPDIPADEIIECDIVDDGDGISVGYNSDGVLIGDLDIDDGLDVDNGGSFYGTAITSSTVDIDDGTVTGELVADGDVDMSSDSVVYGDVYTRGNADIDGGVVHGDVIAEGSVDLNSGSGTVHGTVKEGVSDIDNHR